MSDSDESNEISGTPPEILNAARKASLDLLPEKSRKQYEIVYKRFKEWCERNKVNHISENIMLAYFSEKEKVLKPSSLWSEYSMIKTTLAVKEDIDIKKYLKLISFLKRKSVGYRAKKSKTFTRAEILKFLEEAPDDKYLFMKVVAIIAIAGACRRDELVKMSIDDIENSGSVLVIRVPYTKNNRKRCFVVSNGNSEKINLVDICQKYINLRSATPPHKRFFINYRYGKCTNQVVGINTFGKIPSEIAKYLHLENPSLYTGHCFRRSSATLLADTGADILSLKRHGGWRSSTVAEGYVEDSIQNKTSIAQQILGHKTTTNSSALQEVNKTYQQCINLEETTSSSVPMTINVQNCSNCQVNINFRKN